VLERENGIAELQGKVVRLVTPVESLHDDANADRVQGSALRAGQTRIDADVVKLRSSDEPRRVDQIGIEVDCHGLPSGFWLAISTLIMRYRLPGCFASLMGCWISSLSSARTLYVAVTSKPRRFPRETFTTTATATRTLGR
jgi:hypothetical protein